MFAELIEGAKRAGLLPTGLSAWASVKTTAFGGKAAQGHKQLLRLDTRPSRRPGESDESLGQRIAFRIEERVTGATSEADARHEHGP